MEDYQKKDFAKLLKAGALEGRRWMRATNSEAVRIYDRNLDSFPVTVELFGKFAKVVDYSENGMSDEDILVAKDIISRMVYVEEDKIIFQERKKREGLEQHSAFEETPIVLNVLENGLTFKVDLTTHIDTGLFLDQVNTRSLVRDISKGERVLNLFSYTGSFSVYAAAGGAEKVVSVDMSNTYTKIAKENMKANEFLSEERYAFITEDATKYIKEAESKGEKFDIIIFDPPSFSNSHKMDSPFDIKKDYLSYCVTLNHLLSDDGVLIFSTNLSTFALDKKILKAAFQVRELTEDIRAVGFTKSKSGNSRVWIMKKVAEMKATSVRKRTEKVVRRDKMEEVKDSDLDRLVLSMDEKEESKDSENRPQRKERERRGDERRSKEKRSFGDRRGERGDRRERFSSDRPRFREDRGFSRDRREDRRDSSSRPRYNDENRRDFNRDRDSYRGDRRSSYSDRPRFSDDRRRDDNSSRSRYSDDRRSSYNDRPRYSDDRRRDDRDFRPRYNDDRRSSYQDRPRFSDREQSSDRPRYQRERKSVKPYGYDSFKKSRDRNSSSDDSTFFWRNKDEDK